MDKDQHVAITIHKHENHMDGQLEGCLGVSRSSTFGVLVQVSDVLPGIAAHTLRADVPAHRLAGNDFRRAAVFIPPERTDVGVDLGEDKRRVILEQELALLDGPHRHGAAAVHP